MLLVYLKASKLSEDDKQIFRGLFTKNKGQTITESGEFSEAVDVDLGHDCLILFDSAPWLPVPRFVRTIYII